MADTDKHLLIIELHDFRDVEYQVIRALSTLPEDNCWAGLRNSFETLLSETRGQITRLERALDSLWEAPHPSACQQSRSSSDAPSAVPASTNTSAAPDASQHTREDYDGDGAANQTLVAWARALGDCEPGDDRPDRLPEPSVSTSRQSGRRQEVSSRSRNRRR